MAVNELIYRVVIWVSILGVRKRGAYQNTREDGKHFRTSAGRVPGRANIVAGRSGWAS